VSPSRSLRLAALLLALALPACGDLPQPFRGRPGGLAAQLAQPPGMRVAVPPPTGALLTDDAANRFAEALAEALQAAEVPAAATPALPLDWQVAVEAVREGSGVVPRYTLRDADGNDLGTLDGRAVPARAWAEGGQEPLAEAARQAAPRLADLLLRAEAARKATEPAALARGGPPRVRLVAVGGAPGDGNAALTARMREFLAGRGFVVQEASEGAGFAVQGIVQMVSARAGVQRVELQWIVSRRDGHELGRVVQLNEVPAGSLNGLWGDVAYVAAQQGAAGVQQVIRNAGGLPGEAPPPATQAAEARPGP
jgi:hypothetical protein